jgi:two-component system response regulator RegX3
MAMVSRKKVLVIEDERPIAEPLADALRREGFDVHLAATAAEGLETFSAQAPDIVLLDVMLPDGDGRDVLRHIRQASRTPVVMVSARGEEMDRVLGLELGADDYVTKPFSAAELVARMRAVLRRSTAEPAGASGGVLASGDVTINLDTRTVTRDGEAVELTVKEFEVLRVLLERAGRLVKRDDLVSEATIPPRLATSTPCAASVFASRPRTSSRRELPHPPRPRGRLPRRCGRPRARDSARAQHRAEG